MVWTLFLYGTKVILLGMMVLYVAHIVLTLRNEGLHFRFRLDPRDPVPSAVRRLVRLGVRASSIMLAGPSAVLNVL